MNPTTTSSPKTTVNVQPPTVLTTSAARPVRTSWLPQEIRGFLEIAAFAHASISSLLLPVFLSFIASLFEGASFALLTPAIQGALDGDFKAVLSVPVIGPLISATLGPAPSISKLLLASVALCYAASLGKLVMQYAANHLSTRSIHEFAHSTRVALFERYLSFSNRFFDDHHLIYLNDLMTTHVNLLSKALISIQGSFFAFCSLFIYISIMCAVAPFFAVGALLLLPLLRYATARFVAQIRIESDQSANSHADLSRQIANSLSCMSLVKASSLEQEERERFTRLSSKVSEVNRRVQQSYFILQPLQEGLILSFLFLLLIGFAPAGTSPSSYSLSTMAVFILLLRRSASSFGVFNSLKGDFASVKGPINAILAIFHTPENYSLTSGTLKPEPLSTQLEIRNLHFSYLEGQPVLRGVNITVPKGSLVAIVGTTGAGKSTITNLLMRFYDCPAGSIFVDGRDIREFDVSSWRRQIAYVSQDTFLLNSTLRENITYAAPGPVSDEELQDAIRRSQLLTVVQRLPLGLETEIGERGVRLSGGERQRIALARALLRRTELFILDEATSALDSQTESALQLALEETLVGKTAVIIAHRLSTIRKANLVYVLEHGSIVQAGPFDELRNSSGLFQSLWEAQQL